MPTGKDMNPKDVTLTRKPVVWEVYQVTDLIYRGPRPRNLADLQQLGIKRIISLQSGVYELAVDDVYEVQNPEDFGMEKHLIPCSGIWPPHKFQVEGVMRLLHGSNLCMIPTYIHCKSGVDRTGYMIACYRVKQQGWALVDAVREWVRLGRHWWFWWWKKSLTKEIQRGFNK